MSKPEIKLPAAGVAALSDLHRAFTAKLPEGVAATGRYRAGPGDGFAELAVDLPNGVYRIVGSQWLYTVQNMRLRAAAIATPPQFGGAAVIEVASDVLPKEGDFDGFKKPNKEASAA